MVATAVATLERVAEKGRRFGGERKRTLSLDVIIFKTKHSDVKLLEKPMIDWVKESVKNYTCKVIKYSTRKNEIEQIKKAAKNSKYLLVLYSFNPLLTSENINLCLDYLTLRGEKVVKLPFGYIFETEYLKNIKDVFNPLTFAGNANEFIKIQSKQEIAYATEVLQKRIIRDLILKGVNILNPSSVVVNAYVKVNKDVTIYPFNTLNGNTTISENVVLKEGNVITNSEIGKNSVVANSVIKDSVVSSDCFVFPFNTIENNTFIGENSNIRSYNKLSKAHITENSNIESFNNIKN